MKIVIDEDLHRSLGGTLRAIGYDVFDIRDHGLPPCDTPIVNGCAGDLETTGDLRLVDTSFKKLSRREAAFLQRFCIMMRCWGWMNDEWFHTSSAYHRDKRMLNGL